MATVTVVNPAQVRSGDTLNLGKGRTRKVKNVSFCPSNAECIHLDSECYDTRFTTVERLEP